MVTIPYERYVESADFLKSKLPSGFVPEIAIVCGTGLGNLANTLSGEKTVFNYNEIPGFVKSTVVGHAGKLIFSTLSGKKVVLMQGRFHAYEGHSLQECTFPIRVFKLLGVSVLIATNAAGGMNSNYKKGDVMILNDHLSLPGLVGINPLIGPNIEEFGVRFPAVNDIYDMQLRKLAAKCWLSNDHLVKTRNFVMREGCYAWIIGPCFETTAECQMLKDLGADVVGMSTVPETVVAKHCGMKVLAFSLVTDLVEFQAVPSAIEAAKLELEGKSVPLPHVEETTHEAVLAAAAKRASDIELLVIDIVAKM